MTHDIPVALLSEVSQRIAKQMGLHFPAERREGLIRGLGAAALELGFPDIKSCCEWLLSASLSKAQIEIVASYLTVGETYLYRDAKSFEILEERILPELIRARRESDRRLRLWSAGCCTGEEAYSIAIALSRALSDWHDWNVTILGSDINPVFLRKAAAGVYGDWSFRSAPAWLRDGYFRRLAANRFELLPHIKQMVVFRHLNLVEQGWPSLVTNTNAMDVIFCRNVLMYFAPDRARDVVALLHRALVDGGWLIVSPSETSQGFFSEFETVVCDGVSVYRKRGGVPLAPAYRLEASPTTPPPFAQIPVEQAARPVVQAACLADAKVAEAAPGGQRVSPVPPTAFERAEALSAQGHYAEAAVALQGLCANGQESPAALALLARVYANLGALPAARAWADKAVAADKLDPRARYIQAVILCEQGETDAAMRSLEKALYLDQNFVLAHFTLANLAQRQAQAREARRHFEVALSLLRQCGPDELLPEAEGLTTGRLVEIICSATGEGSPA